MALKPLSNEERQRIFGPIKFKHTPTEDNPEHITIEGDWVKKNIVVVNLPRIGKVQIHRKAADAIRFWFEELKQLDLLKHITSFDGTFCPRLIRGGKSLSNHAYAVAIDLNAAYNPLGKAPAKPGEKGCLYNIATIAEKHGFYWGGRYEKRPDGMHFEFSIDPEAVDEEAA